MRQKPDLTAGCSSPARTAGEVSSTLHVISGCSSLMFIVTTRIVSASRSNMIEYLVLGATVLKL